MTHKLKSKGAWGYTGGEVRERDAVCNNNSNYDNYDNLSR